MIYSKSIQNLYIHAYAKAFKLKEGDPLNSIEYSFWIGKMHELFIEEEYGGKEYFFTAHSEGDYNERFAKWLNDYAKSEAVTG